MRTDIKVPESPDEIVERALDMALGVLKRLGDGGGRVSVEINHSMIYGIPPEEKGATRRVRLIPLSDISETVPVSPGG